ncbi:hypothetical protein P9B03_16235 [Metasolibacillus meyeri]|uniref:DUF3786 domain-containing protein n=1 Tax=Metasolibacillus meyeri TaxID=1071052 RepID=A0AAW9NUA9_9BACL|nr:hypothetical protein [Metasolibacillus meyeri]MEC1180051.1 hypothetical protein [Metasolibacillus meyeri]
MEFLDEKILALRNEMREQERHEEAQQVEVIAAIDLAQDLIVIKDKSIRVKTVSLLDGDITLRMPVLFNEMPNKLAVLKYPSENRPNIIFTDESTTVNLAFSLTTSELMEEEVEQFRDELMEGMEQMQPNAQWLDMGLCSVQDKSISYFMVVTPAIDNHMYNLMFFCSLNGYALIGTFNCLEEESDIWKPIALGIIDSIQFMQEQDEGGIMR